MVTDSVARTFFLKIPTLGQKITKIMSKRKKVLATLSVTIVSSLVARFLALVTTMVTKVDYGN